MRRRWELVLLGSGHSLLGAARPCPDVEVVFGARHLEPPGVGDTGQAFASSLLGEKLKILCHRACNGSDEQLATFKRFRSP